MNSTYVYGHLGLGDHLACSAIIRKLAQSDDAIFVFCKPNNEKSVAYMFRDLENVKTYPIEESKIHIFAQENSIELLKIGHENFLDNFEKNEPFEKSFYNQFHMNFSDKWDFFHVKRDTERENALFSSLGLDNTKYAFIQTTCSRGKCVALKTFDTEIKKIVVPEQQETIFDYCKVIENAEEVHVPDSAFKHLVDFLKPKGKLFYHSYASHLGFGLSKFRNNWKILDSPF